MFGERPAKPTPRRNVERSERLIEQQQGRGNRQSAGKGNLLGLTSRQLRWVQVSQAVEAELFHQTLGNLFRIRGNPTSCTWPERDVLEHVHLVEQEVVLKDDANMSLCHGYEYPLRGCVDQLVADADVAIFDREQSSKHRDDRGLTGPVRAQ